MSKVIIGVTGGIASGKTTVMRFLAKRGIPIVSADELAHHCILRGNPAYKAILRHFGEAILDMGGQISRQKLGRIVFANSAQRRHLEKIVHPYVAKALRRFIQSHHGTMALDIPLLFEAGYATWMDEIWVVYCSQAEQIRRLMRRNGFTRQRALQRIAAQIPLPVKKRHADIVIQNTGTLPMLERQVLSALKNSLTLKSRRV
jgi:dephospho-CoA kinase